MTPGAVPASPSAALIEQLLAPALRRDPSGRSWLPALLAGTLRGRESLGELAAQPGALEFDLAVRGASGRLAAFERRVPAPPALLAWFVEHPQALSEPAADGYSPAETAETRRLRRLLLGDEPRGARLRAQERARELLLTASPYASDWWRFEQAATPECVLLTDRLAITVQTSESEPLAPATQWFPERSRLVRTLEAARQLAGGRRFASLLVADDPAEPAIDELIAAGTPHLDRHAREELRAAFLGRVGWAAARAAVGLSAPDTG